MQRKTGPTKLKQNWTDLRNLVQIYFNLQENPQSVKIPVKLIDFDMKFAVLNVCATKLFDFVPGLKDG